ncbi:MAG: hypothetical protein RIB67_00130 [Miltoncostaeaceae bacterium]
MLNAIKRGSDYAYFFSQLDSPDWIAPLGQKGVFSDPPPPVDDQEGYAVAPLWPASEYLARMAPRAPEDVLRALENVPVVRNPHVLRDILTAGLKMPPEVGASLADTIVSWTSVVGLSANADDLAEFVCRLFQGGQARTGLRLMRVIVAVSQAEYGDDEPLFAVPRVESAAGLGRWDYQDALEKLLAGAHGDTLDQALGVVIETLDIALRAEVSGGVDAPGRDYSEYWRPTLRASRAEEYTDIKKALVGALLRHGERLTQEDPQRLHEFVACLERPGWDILQRLALRLIAQCDHRAVDLARPRLTNPSLFGNPRIEAEYAELAERFGSDLETGELAAVLDWVKNGPPNLSQWAEREKGETGEDPATESVDAHAWAWRLRRLLPFREVLPAEWSEQFDEWERRLGSPVDPRDPSPVVTSWVGPTSPFSADDLSALSADEALKSAISWKPSADRWAPSQEGLGRALREDVARRPAQYSRHAELLCGAEPTLVDHVLSGLAEGAKAGVSLDWPAVLGLCNWLFVSPRSDDEEGCWRRAHEAAGHFVRTVLSRGPGLVPLTLRGEVWSLIEGLCESPDPDDARDRSDAESGWDPPHTALNSVRGVGLQAAIQYGLWLMNSLRPGENKNPDGFGIAPELRDLLERHLDLAVEASIAVRSVYGQYFPWLVLLDGKWASEARGAIFSRSDDRPEYRRAAWGAFLDFNEAYRDVFAMLKDEYQQAISDLPLKARDQPFGRPPTDEQLLRHLMVMHYRGWLAGEPYDYITQAFARASEETRTAAIGFVGRQLAAEGANPTEEILERLKGFWEWRLEQAEASPADHRREMSEFGWWYGSGHFDPESALPLLARAIACARACEDLPGVVERLEADAQERLGLAVDVIRALAHTDERWLGFGAVAEGMRRVLSRALSDGDSHARAKAEEAVHRLGAAGLASFGDLLPRLNA